jgi:hypothetical protein
MFRLICFTIALGVAAFTVTTNGKPAEKSDTPQPLQEKKEVAAKKVLTKEEKQRAHTMQEILLPSLKLALIDYEIWLSTDPGPWPGAQVHYQEKLAHEEKLVRSEVKTILDLDPDSEIANQARTILRRLELLKKNGPTS